MLKWVTLLLALVACAIGAVIPEGIIPQQDNGRIVGGSETTINSFPWQVSVHRDGFHSCGGAIYNNLIVITTANCLYGISSVSEVQIRAGSSYWSYGGFLVPIAAYKNHEGFNPDTMANNIGVVRLSYSLAFSSAIKSVPLAFTAIENGAKAIVSGWGTPATGIYSYAEVLEYAEVEIIDRKECSSSAYGYGNDIKSTMICAGAHGKDFCMGDFGAPLVSDGFLVGIASWGRGCASNTYPGVYTDIANVKLWIDTAAAVV